MINFRHLQAFLALLAGVAGGYIALTHEADTPPVALFFLMATIGLSLMNASQTMHLKQGFRAFAQIIAHLSAITGLILATVSLFIPFQAELVIGLSLLTSGLGHAFATYLPLLKRQKYLSGRIKFFNTQNMFGFVTCEGIDRDIFVHLNSIDPKYRGRLYLDADVAVEFVLTRNEKGLVASRVRPAKKAQAPVSQEETTA